MIVVSDTSPLNYLILIEAADILPRLYEQVYAPRQVVANPMQRFYRWQVRAV